MPYKGTVARKDDPLADEKKRLYFWIYAEKLLEKGFDVRMDASGQMRATCACGKKYMARFGNAEKHYENCAVALKRLARAPIPTQAEYRERMAMLPKAGEVISWTTTDPTGKPITMKLRIEDVESGSGGKH